jgi:DNA primase
VATPVSWDSVAPGLDPAAFTLRTVPQRLAGLNADPWADIDRIRQRLPG